jgi:hypothetical protein
MCERGVAIRYVRIDTVLRSAPHQAVTRLVCAAQSVALSRPVVTDSERGELWND